MRSLLWNHTLSVALAWALSACCAASISAADSQKPAAPNPAAGVRFDQKLNAQLPLDLEFTDEQGQSAPLRDYFGGKPVVLMLVYYKCPMLCGVELDALSRSLQEMKLTAGREFNVVAVSFDPREGPQLAREKREKYLKRYGRHGAENGWRFLTGREENIRQLAETVGFQYRFDEKTRQYAHAAGLMVVTPTGKLSRYLFGIEFPARDLRLALVEASHNRIGSAVDQLLLLCYHYDPAAGKYGFAIFNVIRAAGVATVVALVGLILGLRKLEKARERTLHNPSCKNDPASRAS